MKSFFFFSWVGYSIGFCNLSCWIYCALNRSYLNLKSWSALRFDISAALIYSNESFSWTGMLRLSKSSADEGPSASTASLFEWDSKLMLFLTETWSAVDLVLVTFKLSCWGDSFYVWVAAGVEAPVSVKDAYIAQYKSGSSWYSGGTTLAGFYSIALWPRCLMIWF